MPEAKECNTLSAALLRLCVEKERRGQFEADGERERSVGVGWHKPVNWLTKTRRNLKCILKLRKNQSWDCRWVGGLCLCRGLNP